MLLWMTSVVDFLFKEQVLHLDISMHLHIPFSSIKLSSSSLSVPADPILDLCALRRYGNVVPEPPSDLERAQSLFLRNELDSHQRIRIDDAFFQQMLALFLFRPFSSLHQRSSLLSLLERERSRSDGQSAFFADLELGLCDARL